MATIVGTAGNDNLQGTGDADHMSGGEGDDELRGEAGDDQLDGGPGADRMYGGPGNDLYVVDNGGDLVVEMAGEGFDEVRTALASYSLASLPNIENLTGIAPTGQSLTGNSRANFIQGGPGNDLFYLTYGGDDRVFGGPGNDSFIFASAFTPADIVNGGSGIDTLVVQGNVNLTMNATVTQIENISILAGDNRNFGEPGTNRYSYSLTVNDANFAAGVQARINASALLPGEAFSFNGSFERDASFLVYGGRGQDTLKGGPGNDIFVFGEQRFAAGDTVDGGPGYDGLFLRGNYQFDFNVPGYGHAIVGVENITLLSAMDERYGRGGTEFDYRLTLSDALAGIGRALTVSGALLTASETMVVNGRLESDASLHLIGGASDDELIGGAKGDLLHGNKGADMLTGGGGADLFRYQSIADSHAGSSDRILDFTPSSDRIELSRIDANSLVADDQAFAWIGSAAFSGVAGELRAWQSAGIWYVEGDVNGDSIADLVIALTVQGPTPLGPGDFLL